MIAGQRRVHRVFWLVAAPLLLAAAAVLFFARPDPSPTRVDPPSDGGRP